MSGKSSATPHRATLLVVDDDPAIAELVEGLLDDIFTVRLAHDPMQALQLATRDLPDVALLDVMMQGMSGITLAQRLRALPGGDQIAIYLMSAQHGLRSELESAPISGYFLKPFDPDEIVRMLTPLAKK